MNYPERRGGRRSKRKGDAGEDVAHSLLTMMGARMLQKIATPVRLIPPVSEAARREFFRRVIFSKTVKGDRWGVDPDTGRSILAEVKTYAADRLAYSVLKPHQIAALNEHAACNGLTYLVWVHPTDIFVLRWPIPGFQSGTSISLGQAYAMKEQRING